MKRVKVAGGADNQMGHAGEVILTARIVVYRSGDVPRAITLSAQAFSVGRESSCDVVVDHPEVSRLHAIIEPVVDGFRVVDPGSRNGVIVNGQPLREPWLLHPGDRIQIGDVDLVYSVDDPWRQETQVVPTIS
ncbi:MAG: FHA domain-containing protein [Dehalococcoidia bacterium]